MKVTLAVILALAVAVTAQVSVEDLSVYNYHARIGIPEARRIRRLEEEAAKSGDVSSRIVGGSITDISQTPYQVYNQYYMILFTVLFIIDILVNLKL